jgi:hypothetical protein
MNSRKALEPGKYLTFCDNQNAEIFLFHRRLCEILVKWSGCPAILTPILIKSLSHKGKGKAVPLQAWSGPEGSRKLRFRDFMTIQDGGKVVRLTHRPPLPPGNTPGTHFC